MLLDVDEAFPPQKGYYTLSSSICKSNHRSNQEEEKAKGVNEKYATRISLY